MIVHIIKQGNDKVQFIIDSSSTGSVTKKVTVDLDDLNDMVSKRFEKINEINNISRLRTKDNFKDNNDLVEKLYDIGQLLYFQVFRDFSIEEFIPENEPIIFSLDEELLFLPVEIYSKKMRFLCMDKMAKQIKIETLEKNQKPRQTHEKLNAIILSNPDMDKNLEPIMKKEREEIYNILKEFCIIDHPVIGKRINTNFLMENLWRYQIIYFSGHSVINGNQSTKTGLRLSNNEYLTPEIINKINFSDCKLFFINSCESLFPKGGINGDNIIGPLLKAKVENIIGNTLPVSNNNAYHFALRFFNEMKKGLSISEAICASRKQTFNSWLDLNEEVNDLTWLSVSFFGNPNWKLPEFERAEGERKNIKGPVKLIGHADSVNSIDFSKDGKYLISGSSDHIIKLWDFKESNIIHSFSEHNQQINSVAFSPIGNKIASSSNDGILRIWSIKKNKCIKIIRNIIHKKNKIKTLAFSPKGDNLAFIEELIDEFDEINYQVGLYNFPQERKLHKFPESKDYYINEITCITFHPQNNNLLAVAGDIRYNNKQCILLWIIKEKNLDYITINSDFEKIKSLKYSKSGKYFAACGTKGMLILWEYPQDKNDPIDFYAFSTMHINKTFLSLDFSIDEKSIITTDNNGCLFFWDIKSRKLQKKYEIKQDKITKQTRFMKVNFTSDMTSDNLNPQIHKLPCAKFSPCGKYVAVASEDNNVYIMCENYDDFDYNEIVE